MGMVIATAATRVFLTRNLLGPSPAPSGTNNNTLRTASAMARWLQKMQVHGAVLSAFAGVRVTIATTANQTTRRALVRASAPVRFTGIRSERCEIATLSDLVEY